MLIAVTGADGFVGRTLALRAAALGHRLRPIVRTARRGDPGQIVSGDLTCEACPERLFESCDAVIHLAARVHVLHEAAEDPRAEFMRLNRDLTLSLAAAADRVGVRRFVHASSVAAIGSVLPSNALADDHTAPAPQNPYGESKLAADLGLEGGDWTRLRPVSLRLPTIFGPGVGAFFARLMRAAKLGLPLPLGGFRNLRSFVYVENAADALIAAAGGDTLGSFIVTDSPPRTTAELYRALLRASGRRGWVPALPRAPVNLLARLVLGGRTSSLLGSSAFDGSRFAETFGWTPPVPFEEAIRRTMAA